ncbi:hypothetical protein HOLleu_01418 [Holothuria leucospilota]|uniref:GIY-YIG domain-containing protein n=1 Tax=Holothuria leucospilota TaxID=206669 RepID=A0A9Q1CPA9_HOLLE|nr:hypothetical protein HOLleu_01418 [Holothuria leucospilota]
MGHFEEQLFSQYTGAHPFLYNRYIDDIVGVATGTRQDLESFIQFVGSFSPFLKFTHCISDTSVVFLDLQLSICDRKIKSNLHFKPTDSHNYLLYPSNHPKSCTKSIPYSQLLRARRICSEDSDFSAASKNVLSFFEKRQYPTKILTGTLHRIQGINREEALTRKSNTSTNLRIPLVISHHPSVRPIIRAIYRNVETLRKDPSTRDLFPEPPITAFRVEKNISKHLVRASHPQQPTDNTPGTFPCGRSRCNTCPVVGKNTLINILGSNGNKFSVNQHFTCTSTNLVYILVCGRCNCLYVGETKRRLADRITEHLRSIKQNLQGYRNVETLRHDPSTRDHFPDPPITAFRIEKNISKHLVRASQPQAVVPYTPGTFPCNRGRCNTCPVVSYDKNLSIVGPNNNRFNVHQHFTCTSANVVYVLVCKRCNILYVGETKRRLADRVTEHLRSIKQNLPGFPVATHFNPPSTCSIRE